MRLLLAVFLVACSPTLTPRVECVPGSVAACECLDGREGRQLCIDVNLYAACVCGASDAGVGPDSPVQVPDVVSAPVDRPDAGVPVDVLPMGEQDAGTPDVPAVPDVAPVCPERQRCGSTCVADYTTDPDHCGACFIRCQARGIGTIPACSQGRCVQRCAAGLVSCGVDRCVNPNTPGFDCEMCGYQCLEGYRCEPRLGAARPARCLIVCDRALVSCGTQCVSPTAPGFNCVACGWQCADGLECQLNDGISRCVRR